MKPRLSLAAFAALITVCLAPRADAGCVISPDGRSIDVVTDNGTGNEKTCRELLRIDPRERDGGPVSIQLFGADPQIMRSAAAKR